jgi:hypothetical protein
MRKDLPFAALLSLAALSVMIGAPAACAAQSRNWDDAAIRREMRDFQQFLNDHPWIANKLRQNPSLANNEDFLGGNPELPRFLNAHPYVQQGVRADAKDFMRRQQDFETSPTEPPQGRWDTPGNPEAREQMRDFRNFLGDHRRAAQQLQDDPSLANSQDFLDAHPALRLFLNGHPYVRRAFQADAAGVMRRMERLSPESPGPRGNLGFGDERATRQEMRDFQQFLDEHLWIANKLRQNPSLANDEDFLHSNPELPQFLNAHPHVQAQFRNDPNGFMQRAQELVGKEWGPHAADLAELNQFMANHPWIGNKLKQNPKLANNGDFLNDNKELKDFLGAHPYLQQQFQDDPSGLMERASEFAERN